ALARGGLWPDATVVLAVPAEVSAARRSQRTADRIEAAGEAFHARVAEAYRLLAGTEAGIVVVDGRGDPESVHWAVRSVLAERFPETFARETG
ncbi:MAG TPA: hypothetical protein VMM83_06620, partial [Longimicrobiales bacterium]|nr:hypothetical protein [Longimicrobiales bacterium]